MDEETKNSILETLREQIDGKTTVITFASKQIEEETAIRDALQAQYNAIAAL